MVPAEKGLAIVETEATTRRVVSRVFRSAGVTLVSAGSAELLVHASFAMSPGTRSSSSGDGWRVSGGNMENHSDGGQGLWFGVEPGGSTVEETNHSGAYDSMSATLRVRVTSKESGFVVWSGNAVQKDMTWLERAERVEWIEQAAQLLAREMARSGDRP